MSCVHTFQRFWIGIANIVAIASIVIGVVSYAMNQWVIYQYNGTQPVLSNFLMAPRSRGIFYECLNDPNTAAMSTVQSQGAIVKGDRCIEVDLGQYPAAGKDGIYWYIVVLRRSQVGMHATGFVCVTVALLLSAGLLIQWCCSQNDKRLYRGIRVACGILHGLGGFAYITAMVIFHILMDTEKRYTSPALPLIFSQWTTDQKQMTIISYQVMYGLAWLATGLAFIACFMFFNTVQCCGDTLCCPSDAYTYPYNEAHNRPTRPITYDNNAYLMDGASPAGSRAQDHSGEKDGSSIGVGPRRLPRYMTDEDSKSEALSHVYRMC